MEKKYNVEIEITRECNLCCPGCDRLCNIKPVNKESIMDQDDIFNIINQINKYEINKLTILGGEPTIHKNIYDICSYIQENAKCLLIRLITNNIKTDVVKYIQNNFKKIKVDIFNPNLKNISDIKKYKTSEHYNIMYSPLENNIKTDKIGCWVSEKCGISIFKYNNNIKYYWCGAGTSIAVMLEKDFLFKNSFRELIESDFQSDMCCICPNCIYSLTENQKHNLNKKAVFIKDNNEISNCFLNGLKKFNPHYKIY